MADSDVIHVTTENVEMLHIDFTAPSTRPIYWRSKTILVLQQYLLMLSCCVAYLPYFYYCFLVQPAHFNSTYSRLGWSMRIEGATG